MRELEQLAEPFADEDGFEHVAKAADEEYRDAIRQDIRRIDVEQFMVRVAA